MPLLRSRTSSSPASSRGNAEPTAEAADAFTVPDWAYSTCPSCGRRHLETLFAFPPPPLLNAFVAKARADGARAIVVTPLAVSAPYWNKLLRSSVVPNEEGYIRIRRQQSSLGSDVDGELAIFAVDFAEHAVRTRPQATSPHCGSEHAYRGRPLLGSLADQAERARIHADLHAVPPPFRQPPPSSPPPPSHEDLGV